MGIGYVTSLDKAKLFLKSVHPKGLKGLKVNKMSRHFPNIYSSISALF